MFCSQMSYVHFQLCRGKHSKPCIVHDSTVYLSAYLPIYLSIKIIYFKELVHAIAITEAEKSHNLPSASWRLRKVNGGVPVRVQRPENYRTNGVSSSSKRED